jgi:polyisoprenyl-phosphate glycosyltransferase
MPENVPYLSIVTPVYGCVGCLEELYRRVVAAMNGIAGDFEIIMVNDASPDSAWDVIEALARKDRRVKGINLSRNFGQHRAIAAGLAYARGEWTVVMDCDLQDQPEEIVKLHAKALEGHHIVFARRNERKDGFFKKLGSRLFYRVYDYLTDGSTDHTVANFGIYSRSVIDNYNRFKEQNRSFLFLARWMGFDTAYVDVDHAQRYEGHSSYTLKKLLRLAFDHILSYSNKPLIVFIKFGFLMSLFSLLYGIYIVARYFFYGVSVEGWTTVVVSIYFIGGLLFANLGIIGLYIGKIFEESKERPYYIVEKLTWGTGHENE